MHTSGGRVSTVIGGITYSARGEITIDPSNITVEGAANQDGSIYRTVKAKPITAEVSFDRLVDVNGRPLKWADNIMLQSNLAITFIEQDTGVTHLLSNGFFTGNPQINTATGEVTGVALAAEKYQTLHD